MSGGSEVWISASDWRRAAAVVREQNIRRRERSPGQRPSSRLGTGAAVPRGQNVEGVALDVPVREGESPRRRVGNPATCTPPREERVLQQKHRPGRSLAPLQPDYVDLL